jgi:hypothetical protein
MPLAWPISHPSRLVLVLAKGEFRPIDLTRLLASIDAAKASSNRKLIDVSRLTDKVPTGVLRELARLVRQRESERSVGPIAIVAGTTGVTRQATCSPTKPARAADRDLSRPARGPALAGRFLRFRRSVAAGLQEVARVVRRGCCSP